MDISIIGSGHVGLVSGACFADLGNRVVMVDNDSSKITRLKRGQVWFYEPGLKELVRRSLKERRLSFTHSIAMAVRQSQVIFICVGTPPLPNGEADLSSVEHVSREIARSMSTYRLVVEKSTVPVQTGEWIKRTLQSSVRKNIPFDVASNPEFLREGSGIQDFLHPDRIVLGVETQKAKELLLALYEPLNAPIIVTDVKSAELIKHASNSFLALKISFINAVARICELSGADVVQVAEGMGMDKRIGRSFLNAGVGYGGSCFPKDVAAFIRIAEKLGYDFQLLKAVSQVNTDQRHHLVKRIASSLWNLKGKTIGVLGLAFKPDTDDLREAPSIEVIRLLQEAGARVKVFDPEVMAQMDRSFPGVLGCRDVYEVARGADCLVLLTEWNEFKELDFKRVKRLMRQPLVVDGRNLYEPQRLRKLGFHYLGVGRSDS